MSSFTSFLSKVLGAIFDDVLAPILIEFAKFVINQGISILKEAFSWVLYCAFTWLLKLVNVLSTMFDFFAGTSTGMVTYKGEQTTVLQALFSLEAVDILFGFFTILGVAFTIVLAIINVAKSMSDMTLEDKNPISKVLTNAFKAFISFLIIPVMCLFFLQLSSVIIGVIDTSCKQAMGASGVEGGITIDRVIWLSSSLEAAKDKKNNASYEGNTHEQMMAISNGTDKLRYDYVYGGKDYGYSAVNETDDFKNKFSYADFDYLLGILSGILIAYTLFSAILVFIARMMELLVLYIVGPLFAATIANDGGEMYKQWKEMFIAKFFGGYSIVLGMKLFLVVAPYICSNVVFSTTAIDGINDAGFFSAFIKTVFVIGGAYTIKNSQTMVLRLLSIEAAQGAEGAIDAANSVEKQLRGIAKGSVVGFIGGMLNPAGNNDQKQNQNPGGDNNNSKNQSSKSESSGNAYRGGNPGGA